MTGAEVAARRRRGQELARAFATGDADPDVRLTVLGSFNLDLLPPFLVEALDRRSLAADVTCGAFGQIAEQVLDPSSELATGDARDLVIVPAAEDLLAALYDGTPAATEQERLVDDRLEELAGVIAAALERYPAATLYLVAFGSARAPGAHVLDPADPARGQGAVERFVAGVRELAQDSPRVVAVDFDWHARAAGAAALGDDRLWYLARMRLAPAGLAELADLIARHVAASRGAVRKVAAVDLDGTLWGGIVGEAGAEGVEIGDEGAGLAFRDFQRELAKLRAAGVVLVVCSKNERADAAAVFEHNPAMVLSLDDFAAERINWSDKATSLRELADELGLGIDSFVFLDDNPVEREWIRQALPQVAVPELPEDPAHRPAFLRDAGLFDRIALTEADARRADSYAVQGRRTRARAQTPSFEDFLRSLEQEVLVEPVDAATLPRAAQLCARTNQFNLTGRRHTVADLERMLASGKHELHTVAVRDRFGDSGITGLVIVHIDDDIAELDTFLMSCRVLGRRVEDALLATVAARAAARGARRLVGRYVRSARNGQTERFLPDRGFKPAGAEGVYDLDLIQEELPMPEDMTIQVSAHA